MTIEKLKRPQTLGEEIANAVSHGLGVALSLTATVVMIILGVINGSAAQIISGGVYGGSLIILYTASTLYHSLTNATAKYIFRILDHCSIFLLIFGTYAPISLLLIEGKTGTLLITVNGICAVVGIVFNAINLKKFAKISVLLYVIMGWMCIFTAKPLINSAPANQLMILLLGGIFYTVGIIFFALSKIKYMHFVWHIFVLMGSILQFVFVIYTCF